MRDVKENPRKFIVFLDSLGPDDVEEHMPWVEENCYDGTMDAGNPYVTPKVLGEIYTGKNPGEHGLPSVSRYDQQARTRPAAPTIPEIVAEDDTYENVCQFGLPFILPPEADPTGTYWHSSNAMGQGGIGPSSAEKFLHVPGPAGDLDDLEQDDDLLFNHRQDHAVQTFSTARTLATTQDFDVIFVSCRLLDSYCHYRFDNMADPAGKTDRDVLLEVLDREIEMLSAFGDVFVFGDHGATDLDEVFKINRWLIEHDFLDVEIDEEFREQAIERGLMEEPDVEGTVTQIGMPHVTVNEEESVAVSDDPFSGGLTLLDGANEKDVEEMIAGLEATPYVDEVEWTREMWDGELIDEAPDLYPRRAVGTFISGNLAEEMGGPEITRSGVHDPIGAWGATTDLGTDEYRVDPTDLFDLILDGFLGIGGRGTSEKEYDSTAADEGAARERLRDLGYL